MTTMKVYDIKIIYKDKKMDYDKSGPYFGSYFNEDEAITKALEIEQDENVFMTMVEPTTCMG